MLTRFVPWKQQPYGGIPTKGLGLTSLVLPGQADFDLVSRQRLSTVSGSPSRSVSFQGPGVQLDANQEAIYTTVTPPQIDVTAGMSIVWVGELLGAATTSASLGGITYTGTNITPFVCLEVKRNSTGNNLVINNSLGGSPRSIVSAGAYTTGWVVLVSAVVANRQVFYIRTATSFERITATVAGGLAVTSTARLEIGDSFNARNPNAICSLQAMASRAWSDKECESILADPWGQLFAPRGIRLPIDIGGGGTTYTITPSGGVVMGGTSVDVKGKVLDVSGGITLAGTGSMAFASGGTSYTITPSGGVTMGGSATYIQSKTFAPSGGITLGGTSDMVKTKIIAPTDGVILGGTGSMTSNTVVVTGTIGERTKVGAGT